METNKARLDFFEAFNKVQGAIEPLKPDSSNPHFNSKYASLQAVMEAVGPFLEAGFSFHHEGFAVEGKCFLKTFMVLGDYETVSYAPLVDDGNPQHFQSSQTYVKRGNILNLTGLALDVDDDANSASSEKTVTREPAKTINREAYKPSDSDGMEVTEFIPTDVQFEEGKGKGAGKMFSKILNGATSYGGDEVQGQLALSALESKKKIIVAFARNGKYLNIKRGGVKMAVPGEEIEEVPF